MKLSLICRWFGSQARRPARRPRLTAVKPRLLALEHRVVPAAFHVALTGNNGNTGGAGDPFRTIQAALAAASAASDGADVINVAGGAYNAAGVDQRFDIIASANLQNLQLLGGWDATFTIRNPLATPTDYTFTNSPAVNRYDIQVFDPNTTIDGFTLNSYDGVTPRDADTVLTQTTGVTISNNVVNVGIRPGAGVRPAGVVTGSADNSGLQVLNNTFNVSFAGVPVSGTAAIGVFLNPGPATGVLINGNTFAGNNMNSAIVVSGVNGVTIQNNTINRNTPLFGAGIEIRNSAASVNNSSILNNSIIDSDTSAANSAGGIVLGGSGGINAPVTNTVVRGNIISVAGPSAQGIIARAGTAAASTLIERNSITAPTAGLAAVSVVTGLDVSGNWFGSTTAAGVDTAISAYTSGPGSNPAATIVARSFLSSGADANLAAPGLQLPAATEMLVPQRAATTGLTEVDGRVQSGIDRAVAGMTVRVAADTYFERLVIDKAGVKVIGQGIDVTTIDYTGQTTGQGGVYISGNNAELRSLTVTHSSPNTASMPRYGIKADFVTGSSTTPVNGVVIDSVKVSNSFRTGLDLNGVTNITVNNLHALNNGGAGIFMTDVKGASLSNITTSGNPWVGVSVATFGRFFPLGTNGIVFSGTNSFGESASANLSGQRNGGLQLEMGNFFTPASPEVITWSNQPGDSADVTIQAADLGYMVSGHSFDNANVYRRFYQTLAQAQAAALGTPDHITAGSRYIQDADDSNDFGPRVTQFYVYADPMSKMSIQGAIDAAVNGDVINVANGSYTGNVTATAAGKGITLSPGAGPAQVTVTGNVTLDGNDALAVDVNGSAAGTGHDQWIVNGTVALGGATLNATGTRTANDGDVLVLVKNDGIEAPGTFASQPEGSTKVINGVTYLVTYKYNAETATVGTGNDVALIDISGATAPAPGTIQLVTDPCDPSQMALVVAGTSGDDHIKVQTKGSQTEVDIKSGSFRLTQSFASASFGRIIVYGLAGDDHIQVQDKVTKPAWLFGGNDDDHIQAGSGNTLMLGGSGDDHLQGGKGRDVLIGGAGGDHLQGHGDDDILIAGTTAHDNNFGALCAITDLWGATGPDYNTRRGTLALWLNTSTVLDDGVEDKLQGGSGMDWFFANVSGTGVKDKVSGVKNGEEVIDL